MKPADDQRVVTGHLADFERELVACAQELAARAYPVASDGGPTRASVIAAEATVVALLQRWRRRPDVRSLCRVVPHLVFTPDPASPTLTFYDRFSGTRVESSADIHRLLGWEASS